MDLTVTGLNGVQVPENKEELKSERVIRTFTDLYTQ